MYVSYEWRWQAVCYWKLVRFLHPFLRWNRRSDSLHEMACSVCPASHDSSTEIVVCMLTLPMDRYVYLYTQYEHCLFLLLCKIRMICICYTVVWGRQLRVHVLVAWLVGRSRPSLLACCCSTRCLPEVTSDVSSTENPWRDHVTTIY